MEANISSESTPLFSQLLCLLSTGGITEDEFKAIRPTIRKTNLSTFSVVIALAFLLSVFLLTASHFSPTLSGNKPIYATLFLVCVAAGIWAIAARKGKIGSAALPFVALALGFAYGIYLGVANDKDLPSVTFMVLLLGLPLLVIDRPYRVIGLIVIASAAMIAIALALKEPQAAELDVVDTLCFGCFSIVANVFLTRSQINEVRLRAQAQRELDVDVLTGLRNSHAYHAEISKIEAAVEAGELNVYGAIVADVNNLKDMNDDYGHAAGDMLITASGMLLCKVFVHSPVMRIGGDEFVVILKGSDYENRHELLNQLHERMATESFVCEGVEYGVSIACGLGEFDASKEMRFADVFHDADAAMYENKRQMKIAQGLCGDCR